VNIVNVLLIAGAILLWILSLAALTDLHGSDAAGNGMALAYGVVASIALWSVLGFLLLASASKQAWPAWTKWAGPVLFATCAAASFIAIQLLGNTFYRTRWPIVVPVAAPLLLIAWSVWIYYPSVRDIVPGGLASKAVWGAALVLSLAPWPAFQYRLRHEKDDRAKAAAEWEAGKPQRMEAERRTRRAALDRLGPNTHLREWLEFTGAEDALRAVAFERIRQMERRQADAELMFRQGFTYLERDLPELGLVATPPVCAGSLKYFREMIEGLRPRIDPPPALARVQEFILPYMPGLEWLAENRCDCKEALDELEIVVRMYADSPERTALLGRIAHLRKH
jgi:hypothetical protein